MRVPGRRGTAARAMRSRQRGEGCGEAVGQRPVSWHLYGAVARAKGGGPEKDAAVDSCKITGGYDVEVSCPCYTRCTCVYRGEKIF